MRNLKKSLSQHIEMILRKRIMLLQLAEGEHLIESNLAEEFNISRGPIREAISKLESEGLVSTSSSGRTVVSKFDIQYIKNLYDVRILLETYAIQILTTETVAEEGAKLKEYIQQMEQHIGDNELYREADLNFHFQIVKMSKNKILIKSWLAIRELLLTLIEVTTKASTDRSNDILKEHESIGNEILKGNFENASHHLEVHLHRASKYYSDAVFRLQNEEV